MQVNGKDAYFVAVKVLLRDGDTLLITHDTFDNWDIPGGRLKPNEFEAPLEEVVTRKMREELGSDIQYELGEPAVFFRHERIEHGLDEKVRIFAVGYEATYKGGAIQLGEHHDTYKWVKLSDFAPQEYFEGGWLKGIQEYQERTSA